MSLRQSVAFALVAAAVGGLAGTAVAATTGYVSNPTSNSVDWANAVTALGATVNTNVNFNDIAGTGAVTPAMGGFYSATDGVTFSTSNVTLASTMSPQGYTFNGEGEGVWTPSKLLSAISPGLTPTPAQSVTFAFQSGVLGGGIFLVDYCGGCQRWTITASDINNNVLGSFQSIAQGFQTTNLAGEGKTHQYFLGISSSEANIAFITISRPAIPVYMSGDTVGLDNFRFAAPVPEPETYAMLLAGLGLVGVMTRRRKPTW